MTQTVTCPSCHAPVHVVVPAPSAPPGTAGWIVLFLLLLIAILATTVYVSLVANSIINYFG